MREPASGENELMHETMAYQGYSSRDRTRTLFGQTMGLVALTAGFFALGAYAGRNVSYGWAGIAYIVAFVVLISMNFAVRRSAAAATVLLMVFGVLIGVATAPILVYYANTNPQILWQAGGATALFMAGFGAAGYATRRDLSWLGRISFFAIIGLVVFAGLTMYDFQRLRRARGMESAPLLAASIFLDALNVFLFFLRIFGRGSN